MAKTKETLFSQEQSQAIEIASLKALLAKEREKIDHRDSEIDHLHEVIRQLNTMHFGPRNERWESEEQMRLFNEAEIEASKSRDEEDAGTSKVTGHERKRGKRSPLPKNLERKIIEVELPEDQRFDQDGNPLKVIGKEISEKLTEFRGHNT